MTEKKKKIIDKLNVFFKEELDDLKKNSTDVSATFEINLGIDIFKDEMIERKHEVGLNIDEIKNLFEDYRINCFK